MSKSRKFTLRASLRKIEGCGDCLTFDVYAYRTNAAGNHETYELTLEADRCAARSILGELRKMHVRDRERIEREQRRIEREILELTQE